jgi:hypothetical protein
MIALIRCVTGSTIAVPVPVAVLGIGGVSCAPDSIAVKVLAGVAVLAAGTVLPRVTVEPALPLLPPHDAIRNSVAVNHHRANDLAGKFFTEIPSEQFVRLKSPQTWASMDYCRVCFISRRAQ